MRNKIRSALKPRLGPLPLVIGITGHRDLREEDREALKALLRGIFKEIRSRYPHTPLLLLSPLAEGSDRLAAQVALDYGASLIVPLPMRRELYEKDFLTPSSRAEFDQLLRLAEQYFELPLARNNFSANIQESGEFREQQYAQVGAYIVRHSQILIALWDGVYTNLTGGTAQIVKFHLEGIPETYAPLHSPLDSVESGPVYHIMTPRVSNPEPKGKPLTWRTLFPKSYESHDAAAAAFNRIYGRMDAFNQDALRLDSKLRRQRQRSKDYVLPRHEVQTLPAPLHCILERYAVADTLAIHFQRQTSRTLYGLFGISFCAVCSFQVYAALLPENTWVLALYLVALVMAYGWYFWARRSDYENKYFDYRALAEGLRIQFFWGLAGLADSVAEHYLRKQRSELDWIRNALRGWRIPTGGIASTLRPTTAPDDIAHQMTLILTHWIEDQYAYFAKVGQRNHERLEILEYWVERLFWLAVVLAALLALVLLIPHPLLHELQEWIHHGERVHGWLILFIVMPPVVAAFMDSYSNKRALSDHAKQYKRMSTLFSNAKQNLRKLVETGKYAKAQKLVKELGEEALAENGDWVLLHRERPLEVPTAG